MPEFTQEIKEKISAIATAFEELKKENDKHLDSLDVKGTVDTLIAEKLVRINADISDLSAMKRQFEAMETTLARMTAPTITGDSPAMAEYVKAFDGFIRTGASAGLRELAVKAELSTLVDTEGGFLIPTEINKTIRQLAQPMSAMRSVAQTVSIGAREYTEVIDFGGENAYWTGEKETRPTTDTPELGEISWTANELYSLPKVTQTMLDDADFNVEGWLANAVARAFTAKQGAAWITGSGKKQPKGLLSETIAANASYAWGKLGYIASTNASTIPDSDCLIKLQHALKVPYRPNARWYMGDTTAEAIRLLKDGDGNNIWRPGLLEGAPDILLGKPITYDDYMPTVGAGKYPVAYGDFREGYLIVDRLGIRVVRDILTARPYVAFYTTSRVGGGVRNFEAIKLLKVAAS